MTSEPQAAEQQPDHYDAFAEAYARANENGLFNRWYARPAVLDLLGDVAGGGSWTLAAVLGRSSPICRSEARAWLGSTRARQ